MKRFHRKALVFCLAPLLILGCSQTQPEAASSGQAANEAASKIDPLPTIDGRSPDSVIKTHWALQDWENTNACKLIDAVPRQQQVDSYQKALGEIGSGDYLVTQRLYVEQRLNPCSDFGVFGRIVYQREIIEVRSESETRAVVIAKVRNVTPIPEGVKLDENDLARREFGKDLKYVVERTGAGWRLTQAWTRDLDILALIRGREDPGEWIKEWKSTAERDADVPMAYEYYTVTTY